VGRAGLRERRLRATSPLLPGRHPQPPRAGFPLTLEVGPAQLPKPAWIMISQIRTLSVHRIGRKLGAVPPEEVAQVIEGLNEILGG
jgi:mRNA interferase MazF